MYLHKPEDLFQRALDLTPGDLIIIPCLNYKHMEAVRQSLYRQKWRLISIDPALAHKVIITRRVDKDSHQVTLSQLMPVPDAYILYKDGTMETLMPDATGELERMTKLMVKDGCSQEEIDDVTEKYTRSLQLLKESEGKVSNEQEKPDN